MIQIFGAFITQSFSWVCKKLISHPCKQLIEPLDGIVLFFLKNLTSSLRSHDVPLIDVSWIPNFLLILLFFLEHTNFEWYFVALHDRSHPYLLLMIFHIDYAEYGTMRFHLCNIFSVIHNILHCAYTNSNYLRNSLFHFS